VQRYGNGRGVGQELFTERDRRTAAAAGQEAEVAHADEAARQNMEQKVA